MGKYPSSTEVISLLEEYPNSNSNSDYPFLIISDKFGTNADLVRIHDIKSRSHLSKIPFPSGVGLLLTIKQARKDPQIAAEWIEYAKYVAKLCKIRNCQFIISSGAESVDELVSGSSLDAVLRLCNVDPANYWRELNFWVQNKLAGRTTS